MLVSIDAKLMSAHFYSMQTSQPVKRGGRRIGAGRPKGSGQYGERTVSVRVPLSAVDDVMHLIETGKIKVPLVDMADANEKREQ